MLGPIYESCEHEWFFGRNLAYRGVGGFWAEVSQKREDKERRKIIEVDVERNMSLS